MKNEQMWFGFRYKSGNIQAKRYYEPLDIRKAEKSIFIGKVSESFKAVGRADALEQLQELI